MSPALFLFQLIVFIFSVMIHEISHGYVAERLGDPTARMAGRLTLNPTKHIDPFGSIILPLILAVPALFGQPAIIFGWAKPVPYNPLNLKNPKSGSGLIAAAGPISNIILAAIFGMLFRLLPISGFGDNVELAALFALIVYVNVLLAIFNLVPIPPLDGSKILFSILPGEGGEIVQFLERYGLMILIFFIFFGFTIILPVINYIFTLFTGQNLGY